MVAQLVKSIKPKKLNIDQIRLNLLNALRAEGRAIAKEFDKTTATWKGEKPKFEMLISLTSKDATVIVGAGGSKLGANKWTWIDEGTKPHKIKAKSEPTLWYRKGFTPKTRVNTLSSFAGASFGSYGRPKEISHPGIRPRNFSRVVVKRRKKRFTKAMIEAARIV
jgi:hypothetical protein